MRREWGQNTQSARVLMEGTARAAHVARVLMEGTARAAHVGAVLAENLPAASSQKRPKMSKRLFGL
jgi:hypothetical protein